MNHVLLDNITHKDLKINTEKSAKFGNNIASTLTFPTEFALVQSEYPIFFRKDPNTQEFQSVVMFGFKEGENLFLDDAGWKADYIPLAIDREPFLIGFQKQQHDLMGKTPVIHIDMDSPRVGVTQGEPVFLEHGGNSPYLEKVIKMMRVLHDGLEANKDMFNLFLEFELIEPFALDIQLNDGSERRLAGYYTINQNKLASLDGVALATLNSMGFLQCAFMVVSSLNKVKALVDRKNRLL